MNDIVDQSLRRNIIPSSALPNLWMHALIGSTSEQTLLPLVWHHTIFSFVFVKIAVTARQTRGKHVY